MAKDFLGLLQGYECVGEVDGAYMYNANGTLLMVNTNNVSGKADKLLSDFISEKGIELSPMSSEAGFAFDQEMVTAE